METKHYRLVIIVLILNLFVSAPASIYFAQENTEIPDTENANHIAVPDVLGQTLPQATASLNAAGLQVGNVKTSTTATDIQHGLNSITIQNPSADEMVQAETAVDLTIFREYNVRLFYDDAQLNILNNTDQSLNILNVAFRTEAGHTLELSDIGWQTRDNENARLIVINAHQCLQLWAIAINNFVQPPECNSILGWRVISNIDSQFWIGSEGAERFYVLQDGLERAVCNTGVASCEFYLSNSEIPEDVTEYIYLVYDAHQLYVFNRSRDRWMYLPSIRVANNLTLDNIGIEGTFLDDQHRVAPGQCVVYQRAALEESEINAIADCQVIAQATLPERQLFWIDGFSLRSTFAFDGEERNCPAVRHNQTSICLLPR